ncbi:DUF5062 domain-containing protein [Enterovibrio norvegicus FF-33]|uniref:DUF5062 domain-containing protein n=1 Tax=Enterovibrio norvegicus FF-454 TaxID=1185651 RepID=A0A1E5C8I6_9GAMM|nr:DUF5062 family protein [Enterovibrio norvegicus]OEE61775.1 DUF5062 domain-containing protein [Enterovibrio norvegicus FF-454]OEE66572.1 DUF5062 domain-containing protein [Enterovibrio norvegicus FF-33]OEE77594.1 DUF5062 domain-containing protein [Enterovibrio norvegicus FF-162]
MKKIKHEAQLLKKALQIGEQYAAKRGFTSFDDGTSNKIKIECIYRLLVDDKIIVPLASDKEDGPNMKHKLVLWIQKQLPEGHALLAD